MTTNQKWAKTRHADYECDVKKTQARTRTKTSASSPSNRPGSVNPFEDILVAIVWGARWRSNCYDNYYYYDYCCDYYDYCYNYYYDYNVPTTTTTTTTMSRLRLRATTATTTTHAKTSSEPCTCTFLLPMPPSPSSTPHLLPSFIPSLSSPCLYSPLLSHAHSPFYSPSRCTEQYSTYTNTYIPLWIRV